MELMTESTEWQEQWCVDHTNCEVCGIPIAIVALCEHITSRSAEVYQSLIICETCQFYGLRSVN